MVKMFPLVCLCMALTTACGGSASVPSCAKVGCPHPAGPYVFDGILQEAPKTTPEVADAN